MDSKDNRDVIVFLTVATTGLKKNGFMPEICQITLVNEAGHKLFCKYVLPERSFQAGASLFNGFTITESMDGKRQLMRHSKEVKTHALDKVMDDFLLEISSIRAQVSGRIVLTGYYCQEYDIPLLMTEMTRCDVSMDKLSNMDVVCVDVFNLVRNNRNTLLPRHGGNIKMTTVYNVLCGANNSHMHDAVEDADKLRAIYSKISDLVDKQTFEECVFSFHDVPIWNQVDSCGSLQQPRGTTKRQNTEGGATQEEMAVKKPCKE